MKSRAFTQNKNHSRVLLSGLSALEKAKAVETPDRDTRGWSKSGEVMKNQAFTLIELLVVVLIIGILTAIALPRYQLAVKKAQATQKIVSANAMIRELKAYYLANGTWPASWDDLGVDKPKECVAWQDNGACYITCGAVYRVQLSKGKVSVRYCDADKDDSLANKLCKTLTGLTAPSVAAGVAGTYNRYYYP